MVAGGGPVGLAVIAMLKASGVRTVVASDFSPGRRALAVQMLDDADRIVAIGFFDAAENVIQPKVVLV